MPGKRAAKRIDIKIDVEVKHKSKLQQLYSRNLSKGGIFLSADAALPLGSTVELSFFVKELGRKFKTKAVVVHHHSFDSFEDESTLKEKHGMGFRFVGLSGDDQKIIDNFILGRELKQGA